MPDYAIETDQLGRCFGNIVAVDAVSLAIPTGSVYGFLGPNGAGKTTTIRMLLGLIRPHQGTVCLFGTALAKQRLAALRQVGALVEQPSLYPHLTGRENLEVTRRILGARRLQIDRALATVGLAAAASRVVRGYSLGMRQRLGLALALLNEPQLLILDEPTNGLDPAGIHEMRDLIRRLPAEHGITVFLSSHMLSEVEQIATHLGIINAGRLYFQGTLAELQAQRPAQLVLEVGQPAAALQLLAAAGWPATMTTDKLVISGPAVGLAAEVNATLVQAGIDVLALGRQRPSLEQMFLSMTGRNLPGEEGYDQPMA